MRRKHDARSEMESATGAAEPQDTLTLLRALVLAEEYLAVAQQRLAAARTQVAQVEAQRISLRAASSSASAQTPGTTGLPRMLMSVREAAAALSVGHTQLYHLVMSGELRTIRIGRRRLVAISTLEAFIADRLTEAL